MTEKLVLVPVPVVLLLLPLLPPPPPPPPTVCLRVVLLFGLMRRACAADRVANPIHGAGSQAGLVTVAMPGLANFILGRAGEFQ